MLQKIIYTEHKLANKLKDVSINEYKPKWNDNESQIVITNKTKEEKKIEDTAKKEQIEENQKQKEIIINSFDQF